MLLFLLLLSIVFPAVEEMGYADTICMSYSNGSDLHRVQGCTERSTKAAETCCFCAVIHDCTEAASMGRVMLP